MFFNRVGSLNLLDTCGANSQPLVLRIRKWDLDDAHKDKANKFYSPDFKVKSYVGYSVFYVCSYYIFVMVEIMWSKFSLTTNLRSKPMEFICYTLI